MNNNQQPGWPQQPDNQPQQPENGQQYPPIPPAPGQAPGQSWPPPQSHPSEQHGQQAYGAPGQQYAQAPAFTQTPPKPGIPVWGWVAGGATVVAVIAVAGVMAFNGLASGNKQSDAAPGPVVSESAASGESAEPLASTGASADAGEAVYLFDESDFSSPPAWLIKEPAGWTKKEVKDGMLSYTNAGLQCTFTTYQAKLEPTGETGDEATTALVMASEIKAVEKSVGKPVEVIDDAASTYVKLRGGNNDIELQEAELRFKNDKDIDVSYRMAVRATASSNGLMELALACPGSLTTESELWLELTDAVSMVDAP